jgi:hypothetical protein
MVIKSDKKKIKEDDFFFLNSNLKIISIKIINNKKNEDHI